MTIDGVVQPAPTQLPWYPDGLGWQINVGKTVIRKSPEYRKLQQFLVYETDVVRLAGSFSFPAQSSARLPLTLLSSLALREISRARRPSR